MNVAVPSSEVRIAASPYARRLARDRMLDLADLTGSGPKGRIVAADVMAHPVTSAGSTMSAPHEAHSADRPQGIDQPGAIVPSPASTATSFATTVSLDALNQLIADAARAGLKISVEDAALRAARAALGGMSGDVALETEGRQILVSGTSVLSIGSERRQRLAAIARGEDAARLPALACLLVLHSARAMPLVMPPLPGRALRLVLSVDGEGQLGRALVCAFDAAIEPARTASALEAFAEALENPLALLA